MLNVLLIRTGTTEYESQGRIQGVLDIPLSVDGKRKVSEAGDQMAQSGVELSALYTGPCLSAQQTSEILGERLNLKPKTLDALRNLNQGLWQGLLVSDVRSKQPKVYRQWEDQPETVCPPEGETIASARSRLEKAVKKLTRKHKTGTIGLVAPEPVASVLECQLRASHLTSLWDAVEARDSEKLWEAISLVPTP
ncbi:MAG: histidine phosphatase family protein [Planctomycetales bacterium]|nr:histidine phosphatase family protein [Planctomycetales bacterium]